GGGRMELTTWTLDGQSDGPHVLISAGVHGDEFEPMAALRRLGVDMAKRTLRGRLTLIPVVNEDAFRLGQRTASDGLDLARVCPGRSDGSITERVAHALSRLIRSADLYLDLHTGGSKLTVQPLAGYMLHHDAGVRTRQRRLARIFGLPIVWGTDPSLEGRSLSVARDARVPAIYVEYLGGGGFHPEGVTALEAGCRNVLADLGMIDDPVQIPESEPLVIEDDRTNSGFIQNQHRAPAAGLFEPAVKLGQSVRRGDVLGTISDLLGRHVVTVRVEQSGMLIVLRTFSWVSESDGLGVILEIDHPPTARLKPPVGVT
ncbi:MAG TPA: M14 family metallopeptidase, partial [Isosphaeraceae bacterium]|nr:M14 family metallopeptidase [Isosphaeraceae bacterium]